MANVLVWRAALVLQLATVFCLANSPPSISGKVESRVISKLGSTTRLVCPADADYTTWKKDGQSLKAGWERFKVVRQRDLRIKDTQMEDAGTYTCIATNGFGSININYTVIVLDEDNKVFQEGDKQYPITPDEDIYKDGAVPYFEEIEKMRLSMNLVKPEGSSIRLYCRAEGNPKPEVRWLKNGQPVDKKNHQATLKLPNIQQDSSGAYTCIAGNRLGQVNFTYNLQVIAEIQDRPKLIAPHPLSQTVQTGKTVSFQCFIESELEPDVQWLKQVVRAEELQRLEQKIFEYEGKKFIVLRNMGELLEISDGSFLNKLVIQNVQPEDAGMFVCLAANKKGYNVRHAFLHVAPATGSESYGPGGEASAGLNPSMNLDSINSQSESVREEEEDDQGADDDANLALLIGIPACVVLVIILLVVFLMQRYNQCQHSRPSASTPRPPVPNHEREAYYYSNCQQQQHTINPLLNPVEKFPKTPTPSVDMTYSEISSASRSHPNPYYYHHNHVQNGYN